MNFPHWIYLPGLLEREKNPDFRSQCLLKTSDMFLFKNRSASPGKTFLGLALAIYLLNDLLTYVTELSLRDLEEGADGAGGDLLSTPGPVPVTVEPLQGDGGGENSDTDELLHKPNFRGNFDFSNIRNSEARF